MRWSAIGFVLVAASYLASAWLSSGPYHVPWADIPGPALSVAAAMLVLAGATRGRFPLYVGLVVLPPAAIVLAGVESTADLVAHSLARSPLLLIAPVIIAIVADALATLHREGEALAARQAAAARWQLFLNTAARDELGAIASWDILGDQERRRVLELSYRLRALLSPGLEIGSESLADRLWDIHKDDRWWPRTDGRPPTLTAIPAGLCVADDVAELACRLIGWATADLATDGWAPKLSVSSGALFGSVDTVTVSLVSRWGGDRLSAATVARIEALDHAAFRVQAWAFADGGFSVNAEIRGLASAATPIRLAFAS